MTDLNECPGGEVWEDHERATACTCTNWCGEAPDAGCCYCNHMDIYMPCPVVGYGCGMGATAATVRCDCCSDAEWAAASGVSA